MKTGDSGKKVAKVSVAWVEPKNLLIYTYSTHKKIKCKQTSFHYQSPWQFFILLKRIKL